MDFKYSFVTFETEKYVFYIPVADSVGELSGVLAVDVDADEIKTMLEEGVDQMGLVNLLVSRESELKLVNIPANEMEVIRDLSIKASTGRCSQYTFQELSSMLEGAMES